MRPFIGQTLLILRFGPWPFRMQSIFTTTCRIRPLDYLRPIFLQNPGGPSTSFTIFTSGVAQSTFWKKQWQMARSVLAGSHVQLAAFSWACRPSMPALCPSFSIRRQVTSLHSFTSFVKTGSPLLHRPSIVFLTSIRQLGQFCSETPSTNTPLTMATTTSMPP
jgi:hypothetical protein